MAMEMQVAEWLSEEEIRSMAADDIIDPNVEEILRDALSGMQSMRADADADCFPFVSQLDWVDVREDYAVLIRDAADAELTNLGQGLAVFAGRAGEEALVSQLRKQAAWCAARRAQADALLDAARSLRDRWLRYVATAEYDEDENELVPAAAQAFMEFLAREMDGGTVPEADAARADAIHAAATAGHGVAARFAAEFVRLADRFRRAAETYAGQQEWAIAEGLRRRAAEVEVLCADPEALVPRMQATGWWMFWRYMNELAAPKPTPTPDASASSFIQ